MSGKAGKTVLRKVFKSKEEATENAIDETKFKILFYFEKIAKGKNLLKLANTLTQNKKETSVVTALHMVNSSDVDLLNDEYEEEVFLPIEEEARKLNQNVINLYKVSTDVDSEIVDVAHKGNYDLILMGLGRSEEHTSELQSRPHRVGRL